MLTKAFFPKLTELARRLDYATRCSATFVENCSQHFLNGGIQASIDRREILRSIKVLTQRKSFNVMAQSLICSG